MSNDQKTQKIRTALAQLDAANDQHWTEDGLPREGIVRKLASDNTISRKDISDAQPGFQRNPVAPGPKAGDNVDELTGETIAPADAVEGAKSDAAANKVAADADGADSQDGSNADPSKNTGELMTESEVRTILEKRVTDAEQAVADAQKAVRDSQKAVLDRQSDLQGARDDFRREFPPMTQAENVKQYIASEMAQRARAHGYNGLAPGSQIDAAMQRSNSRGWRRPSRVGRTSTSGVNAG